MSKSPFQKINMCLRSNFKLIVIYKLRNYFKFHVTSKNWTRNRSDMSNRVNLSQWNQAIQWINLIRSTLVHSVAMIYLLKHVSTFERTTICDKSTHSIMYVYSSGNVVRIPNLVRVEQQIERVHSIHGASEMGRKIVILLIAW